MVSEPDKVEEFDNLEEDAEEKDPAGSAGAGLTEEGIPVGGDLLVEGGEDMEDGDDLEPVDEAPEMMFSKESMEAKDQEEVLVKYCLFCREIIPADAIACKFCGHVVHIFEGKVFKQLYWFLWGGVIAFIGTLLPFYGGEVSLVTACTTFPGAMYLVFSILLLYAMVMSIYAKRLIMSPVFLMFIPAVHTWWTMVKQIGKHSDYSWYQFIYDIDALNWLSGTVGSGLLLILIGSTIVVLTFIFSLFSAVAGGGKGQQGEKSPARGKRSRR